MVRFCLFWFRSRSKVWFFCVLIFQQGLSFVRHILFWFVLIHKLCSLSVVYYHLRSFIWWFFMLKDSFQVYTKQTERTCWAYFEYIHITEEKYNNWITFPSACTAKEGTSKHGCCASTVRRILKQSLYISSNHSRTFFCLFLLYIIGRRILNNTFTIRRSWTLRAPTTLYRRHSHSKRFAPYKKNSN